MKLCKRSCKCEQARYPKFHAICKIDTVVASDASESHNGSLRDARCTVVLRRLSALDPSWDMRMEDSVRLRKILPILGEAESERSSFVGWWNDKATVY